MTGTHRPPRRASLGVAGLLAVGTLWMAWPLPAAAQTRNRLELQFGMGLAGDVIGQENPFEILYGTWDVGATFWLTGHWGVGVRQWRQVGRAAPDTARFSPARDDAPPFAVTGVAITGPAYDETIAQVFVRRRWFLADTELDLGVSVLKRWSQGFSNLLLPDDREPHGTVSERRRTLPEEWAGPRPVFLDFLVGRKVSRRLGVKAGVTTRQNLRPVNWLVLGVVSFGKHS